MRRRERGECGQWQSGVCGVLCVLLAAREIADMGEHATRSHGTRACEFAPGYINWKADGSFGSRGRKNFNIRGTKYILKGEKHEARTQSH